MALPYSLQGATLPDGDVGSRLRSHPVALEWLPGGDAGILRTLRAMRTAARAASSHPLLRQAVTDTGGNWRTMREWIAHRSRFAFDPKGIELVQSPEAQLWAIRKHGTVFGDCDDVATLAGALTLAAGQRARFVVLGFGSPGPAAPYSHVFTEMLTPHGWRDFDITRRPETPRPTRRMVWRV